MGHVYITSASRHHHRHRHRRHLRCPLKQGKARKERTEQKEEGEKSLYAFVTGVTSRSSIFERKLVKQRGGEGGKEEEAQPHLHHSLPGLHSAKKWHCLPKRFRLRTVY